MTVTPIKLGTRSNPARADVVSVARIINGYVEAAGEEGAATLPIYACDGFSLSATLTGGGATRAMLPYSSSVLYCVSGSKLFKVTSGGAVTDLGTVASTGVVTMGRNRREPNAQVAISSGGTFYVLDSDVLSTVSLADLESPGDLVAVLAHHGYFLLLMSNGEFFITAIDNGSSIDSLDFASSNANPDGLVGGAIRGDDVCLFGERSIEFWRDTGAADFPFERSATTGIGCYAQGTIANVIAAGESGVTDSVVWVATDATGAYAGVMILDGYSGRKVSPPDLDRRLMASDPSTLSAFSYASRGHVFYVISGADFTWQWDATTGWWSERASSGLDRWRISNAAPLGTATYVGDYATGALYTLSSSLSVASDSALTIRQSNDSGATWSAARTITVGGTGNRTQRFKSLRFGQSKEDGKVVELVVTNAVAENGTGVSMTVIPPHIHSWPNPIRLHAVYIDVVPGSSQNSRPKAITRAAVDVEAVVA